MATLDQIPAVKIFDKDYTLREVLYTLKIREDLEEAIQSAVDEIIVMRKAEELGISVSDEELQKEADQLRQVLQLNKAEDTLAWLSENHQTVDDFETRVERELLTDKVKDSLAADKIDGYFAENRFRFDQAVLSQIVVADEATADELATQLREEEAEWSDLVGKSIDEGSKSQDGSVGLVVRSDLSPAVQAAVFNAGSGDIVGPVKTDMGYHIIRVDELKLGELDEDTREQIREAIYAEWIASEHERARTEVLLYEAI